MGCKTYHHHVRIATLRVFSYNISMLYTERLKIFSCDSCERAHDNADRLSAVILSCSQVDALLKNMTSISRHLIGQILL